MIKSKHAIFASIITLTLILASCGSSKKAVNTIDKEYAPTNAQLKKIASNYHEWNTFSTSGKISFGMGNSFSSAMQLRMVRDKSIFISLRPLLGIEMGKLYISPDSIIVVDKFHKVYLAESLRQFSNALPMSLGALQDLFLNRIFSLKAGTLSASDGHNFDIQDLGSNAGYTVTPRSQYKEFNYSFILNAALQLTQLAVKPAGSATKYAVEYSDFSDTNHGTVASAIAIATRIGDKDVSLALEYNSSKIKWDSSFEDTPSINQGYRRITAQELPELLKQLK